MVAMETCEPSVARFDFSIDTGNSNTLVQNHLISHVGKLVFLLVFFFFFKVSVKKNMPVAIKRKKT